MDFDTIDPGILLEHLSDLVVVLLIFFQKFVYDILHPSKADKAQFLPLSNTLCCGLAAWENKMHSPELPGEGTVNF